MRYIIIPLAIIFYLYVTYISIKNLNSCNKTRINISTGVWIIITIILTIVVSVTFW